MLMMNSLVVLNKVSTHLPPGVFTMSATSTVGVNNQKWKGDRKGKQLNKDHNQCSPT